MKKNAISFLALCFLCLFSFTSCEKEDDKKEWEDKETICDNTQATGYKTMTIGSSTRTYVLYVPQNYDSATAKPLIINFHGFGGCAADFADLVGNTYGMNALADTEDFIVVYPQAEEGPKGSAYWDPGDSGVEDIGTNDIYFTEKLIDEIAKDYNVNRSRVYATGYSNGGMMSYGLACTRGDIIAAVGIMSGVMLDGTCNSAHTTSAIHFHGEGDNVLPLNGNIDYQAIQDVVNSWLTHNGIASSSLVQTTLNNGDVVKDVYTDNTTSVVLYTVKQEYGKTGGHVWFSEDIDGQNPNKILWDFLNQYTL